ncbi:MAG TPA: metalloregulator ArsR/SmtB family transcription factor [bacterium]|jgi:DNA-binding transcriptional ArsR family regulator|nr:metalloregulator ArsR/SmtB family transcription factor [bacterium]
MPDLDQLLVAVSHGARRAILARLKQGPLGVTEIAAPFDLSLNAVSKHLKVLEAAGLIRRERQGREHLISLQAGALRNVADWARGYEAIWNHQLDRLEGHFRAKRRSKP